jgi:hypothetical protein
MSEDGVPKVVEEAAAAIAAERARLMGFGSQKPTATDRAYARVALDRRVVPELAGFAEAAEILGVKKPNLMKVAGLPEPIAKLQSGSVWVADELRRLAEERAAR